MIHDDQQQTVVTFFLWAFIIVYLYLLIGCCIISPTASKRYHSELIPYSTMKTVFFLSSYLALSHAFTMPQKSGVTTKLDMVSTSNSDEESRRGFFNTLGLMGVLTTTATIISPEQALASGGATAGRYT
jgi:hypothetical protein